MLCLPHLPWHLPFLGDIGSMDHNLEANLANAFVSNSTPSE